VAVFQVFESDVAQELLKLPFASVIFFHGSPAVGKNRDWKAAAGNLTSVTLDIGRKISRNN